ncbi:hypothetical protein PsAD2_04348 [Pseudovibrio axinellae]|uniref:XapX domain protein n=1 Tax=Pseudovibrio axinellae TaxID=989403 RepID=A0A165T4Q1_9HYPH|nr:DUF1427 family protein [Pseudovibrio axinellae]KZL05423.1 hypothetical protein PsAD2_04348 [Pseudovibrio axinellae]SEP99876.1 XapX domain-containing protein [Pseudovibrio axinellae]
MTELLLSTFAGFVIGAIFTAIKLPIPAPPVLSGCVAILGVWGGHQVMQQVTERFFS